MCAAALAAASVGVGVTAPARAANDYTWTGAGATADWAVGANWSGGLSPSGTVGSLNFPQLTSAACTASMPTATCYRSTNNASGIGASAITIDDNAPYDVGTGYNIDLGAGGLTATPDDSTALPDAPTTFELGFALTAPQTWTIDGGQEGADGLVIENGSITGDEPLTIDLKNGATLQTDAEVGSFTASGDGLLIPAYGDAPGSINANGNPVGLEQGAGIWADTADSDVGPLTADDGSMLVGDGAAPEFAFTVDGDLTLDGSSGGDSEVDLFIDQTGTAAGEDYSQLIAKGDIDLNGVSLDLNQGVNRNGDCVDLNPGDADTIVQSTGGTLTGTFAGVPDGTTVPIANLCDETNGTATATIHYTATAVTATIATGGNAGDAAQNTSPPTITGSAIIGQTLTAAPGAWAGDPAYAYQWYSCTAQSCSAISGATSTTYEPTAAQLGDALFVAVTGTNAVGSATAASDPTSAVKAAVPANTALPAISGGTTVGDTLSASSGSWSGSPSSYGYQWLRCSSTGTSCAAITGATATTYVSKSADVGARLAVQVTATNSTGAGSPVASTPTAAITAAATAPTLLSAPSVAGDPLVGKTLSGAAARFTGSPLTLAYAWQRCTGTVVASCTAIPGANGLSYVTQPADVGNRLRFVTVAANSAGQADGVSAATAIATSPAAIRSSLRSALTVPAATTVRAVIAHGVPAVHYTAPWAGTLTLSWSTHQGGKGVTVATGQRTVSPAGAVRIKLTLTRTGRQLLKRLRGQGRKLIATSTARFAATGSATIVASRALVLKP